MLIPVYSFLRGDTLGLIVLVQDHHTVAELCARALQAASPRVAPASRAAVFARGKRLDPQQKVSETGLRPLDRVDVIPEPADGL